MKRAQHVHCHWIEFLGFGYKLEEFIVLVQEEQEVLYNRVLGCDAT